jgi:hypothetical protein
MKWLVADILLFQPSSGGEISRSLNDISVYQFIMYALSFSSSSSSSLLYFVKLLALRA